MAKTTQSLSTRLSRGHNGKTGLGRGPSRATAQRAKYHRMPMSQNCSGSSLLVSKGYRRRFLKSQARCCQAQRLGQVALQVPIMIMEAMPCIDRRVRRKRTCRAMSADSSADEPRLLRQYATLKTALVPIKLDGSPCGQLACSRALIRASWRLGFAQSAL